MAAMILLKRREVMTGKPSIVSRIGSNTDHIFHALFTSVGKGFSYINKHTFIALAHLIAFYILKNIRHVYIELKHRFISNPQGKKLIDAVRGRGEVTDHGASFYLRRIAPKDE
ncbi:MAG: hypothetical protein JWO00_42 [Candidatus Parcubacteria bacterium]|nr:hypothetical protein [Candidatus Parcubacteria bacterium]